MTYNRKTMSSRIRSLLGLGVLFVSTAFAHPPAEERVRIAIPGVTGALEINVGSASWIKDFGEDGREAQLSAMGRADQLLITAFLQRVKFPGSTERCRKEWWSLTKKGANLRRDDLDESGIKDGIARVEFIIPEFAGAEIRQKNIHAYLGSGDLCAEVHLSKVQFKPGDQGLFEEVLASVRLLPEEPPAPEPNTMRYVFDADRSYMHRDFKAAAKSFQKALDLEAQHRTLNRDTFRQLVLGLGMSRFLSGDMNGVKTAVEQGIAEDPEYPLFYYLMARTYAETGNKDGSLEQLRLAFKYRHNLPPGADPLPDPLLDYAFRRLKTDPEFLRSVRALQQP